MTNKKRSGKVGARHLDTLSRNEIAERIKASSCTFSEDKRELIPDVIKKLITTFIEKLASGVSVRLKKIGTLDIVYKKPRGGVRSLAAKDKKEMVLPAHWTVSLRRTPQGRDNLVFGWRDMINTIMDNFPQFTIEDSRHVLKELMTQFKRIEQGTTRIELRGLGSFFPSYREARKARNPKTGEVFNREPRYVLRYKRSTTLHRQINDNMSSLDSLFEAHAKEIKSA